MTMAEKLRQEGRKEGRIQGKLEGKLEGKIEIAKNMLKNGMDIDQIIKLTELEEKKIKLLKEEIQH